VSLTRRQVTSAAVAALPLAVAAAAPASARPHRGPRTLHIAGDSTAAQKYADAAPETGWGMALPFFLHGDIVVANHAVNGRSSKSFIDEKTIDPTRYGIHSQCSGLQAGGEANLVVATRSAAVAFRRSRTLPAPVTDRLCVPGDVAGSTCLV
jgi:hypothetical protein